MHGMTSVTKASNVHVHLPGKSALSQTDVTPTSCRTARHSVWRRCAAIAENVFTRRANGFTKTDIRVLPVHPSSHQIPFTLYSVLREEHFSRHRSDVITPVKVPVSDITARVAQDMLGHTWQCHVYYRSRVGTAGNGVTPTKHT